MTSSPRTKKASNKANMELPLDLSFMTLTEMSEVETEEPRELGKGKKPQRDEDGKFNSKCIKLNNNSLKEIKDLHTCLQKIILYPEAISWIDLSFNSIVKVDSCLCEFTNLQILALHGNAIEDLKEVDKLAGLSKLKKLSLHGNPIEHKKNYRWTVLSQIPQLNNFDMSAVTKADRATAETWKRTNPGKKKKRRDIEA